MRRGGDKMGNLGFPDFYIAMCFNVHTLVSYIE